MIEAIKAAIRRLSAIPFFPSDEDARLEIMYTLEDVIGTEILHGSSPQQRIDWLVKAAVNVMRRWGGIPELRGLLCTRWRPADGIETYSTLQGHRQEDFETQRLAEHRSHKAVEAGSAAPKLLEPAECDRMPDDELAQLHRDVIGKLVEATRFPRSKSLAQREKELAEAPRRDLSAAEKARRLAELEAGLKVSIEKEKRK